MIQKRKLISIVMPVLNEEEGLAKTIREIPVDELKRMGYDCEIIVVDGCSTDKSREVARKLGAKVIIEPRPGYGNAYKTGFRKARGEIIVALDADYSYPAYLLPRLINILEKKKLDFISTHRLHKYAEKCMPPLHIVGNKILTLLVRVLFRLNINDSQSGMWVFRRKIVESIDFFAGGMAFSQELKIYAFKNFKSIEVPIPYRKRVGRQKLNAIIDGFKNLLHLVGLCLMLNEVIRLADFTRIYKIINIGIFGGNANASGNNYRVVPSTYWWTRKQIC